MYICKYIYIYICTTTTIRVVFSPSHRNFHIHTYICIDDTIKDTVLRGINFYISKMKIRRERDYADGILYRYNS